MTTDLTPTLTAVGEKRLAKNGAAKVERRSRRVNDNRQTHWREAIGETPAKTTERRMTSVINNTHEKNIFAKYGRRNGKLHFLCVTLLLQSYKYFVLSSRKVLANFYCKSSIIFLISIATASQSLLPAMENNDATSPYNKTASEVEAERLAACDTIKNKREREEKEILLKAEEAILKKDVRQNGEVDLLIGLIGDLKIECALPLLVKHYNIELDKGTFRRGASYRWTAFYPCMNALIKYKWRAVPELIGLVKTKQLRESDYEIVHKSFTLICGEKTTNDMVELFIRNERNNTFRDNISKFMEYIKKRSDPESNDRATPPPSTGNEKNHEVREGKDGK